MLNDIAASSMYSTYSKSSSNLLDGLYACINARVPRFEPRYKFIRDTKSLDEQLFIDDFSKLPLYVTSFSDDLDEQLDSLNLLFTECLERHAPLRKVKVTRPPAPWMETYRRPATREEHPQTRGSPSKCSQLYVELFPLSTK